MTWVVRVEEVWKRYARSLRHGARYALQDGVRSFLGLAPASPRLREQEFWGLRELSFQLEAGESLALCGRNGAGKSTLLKLLAGVIQPDRGELRVRGRTVALLLAGAGFHPLLSGRENLFVYGSLLGMSREELESALPELVAFAGLEEFLDAPVKSYSSGMVVRLAFAVGAHSRPRLLLIDEALAVGDAAFRERCLSRLRQLKEEGTSLVVASHSSQQLRRLCDRALWLERGRARLLGPVGEVLERYADDLERRPAERVGPEAPPAAPAAPVIALEPRLDGAPLPEACALRAGEEHLLAVTWTPRDRGAATVGLRLTSPEGAVAGLSCALNPATLPAGPLRLELAFRLTGRAEAGRLELLGDGALLAGLPCRSEGQDAPPPEPAEVVDRFGLAGLEGGPALIARRAAPGGAAEAAPLELRRLELRGDGARLGPLLQPDPTAPRLSWDLPGDPPQEVCLEQGELLGLRLTLRARAPLSGWRARLAFQDEAGRESGWSGALPLEGVAEEELELELRARVDLPAGRYALACQLEAAASEGQGAPTRLRVAPPAPLACRVLGPPRAGNAEGLADLLAVREVAAGAPGRSELPEAPAPEGAPVRGERARIEAVEVAPAGVAPGQTQRVQVTVAWLGPVARPCFKLAWAAPDGRVGARLLHDPGAWPLAAAQAGERRCYELEVRPRCGPGPWELRAAVCAEEDGQRLVLDGRHQAAWTAVAAEAVAEPPRGLLRGQVRVWPVAAARA